MLLILPPLFPPAESLPGCRGGQHRSADLSALRRFFPRHVLAARAAGPPEGDAAGGGCPSEQNRRHGPGHVQGASPGPPHYSDSQQLCQTAQQAEADGGGASDAAHRAAAALHLGVCWSAGAHRHHQGGAATGAAGHSQLQVELTNASYSCFILKNVAKQKPYLIGS